MAIPVFIVCTIGFGILAMLAVLEAVKRSAARIDKRIAEVGARISDVHLVTPTTPGVQGTVSARLFEAMKDVCDCGRAENQAEALHDSLKRNPVVLQAEVERAWKSYMDKIGFRKAAVDRYLKIMVDQPAQHAAKGA